MFKYDFTTYSQKGTEDLGKRFSGALKPGTEIAMYGDLGSGKTAFTRGALRGLGFEGNVSSPTFAIVNEYRGGRLDAAHFDMYRISSEDDLYGTGFYDYLDGSMVLFMEWCENIPFAVDDSAVKVIFERGEGNVRYIRIEAPEELSVW
ncbi:MAG: tRNA (adenosine(37)-N6)-threonylcarbamoyltransferase complex ATPase subunit type 1 TsaE [Oscillospiraceae bacterium]|nr:tRNA (adenosine(37)-N6)-threonylcarbamoyltransferase complex ATPase subunit type 1 TsaE [Oscillospiraceae bacterium]